MFYISVASLHTFPGLFAVKALVRTITGNFSAPYKYVFTVVDKGVAVYSQVPRSALCS